MFVQALLHWATAAIYFSPAYGKLYTSPDLTKSVYDYIVIGGENPTFEMATESSYLIAGAAGSVVSAHLSEDPDISVLVVEAGIS